MQSTEPCRVESCASPKSARGLCKPHYALHRKLGTLDQFALVGKKPRNLDPCLIEGCGLPNKSRGWCVNHYARWTRTGNPLGFSVTQRTVEERFYDSVDKTESCWNWLRQGSPSGYGTFWSGPTGSTWLAHRWSYTNFVAPIPQGFHIDHLCSNRLCVNPSHLEAVTPQENQLRAVSVRVQKSGGRCPNGHLLSEVGTNLVYDKWTRCNACVQFSSKRPRQSRSEMEK